MRAGPSGDGDSFEIPAGFWSIVTPQDWKDIWKNNGCLNASLCRRLWDFLKLPGPSPDAMTLLFKRSDIDRLIEERKGRNA